MITWTYLTFPQCQNHWNLFSFCPIGDDWLQYKNEDPNAEHHAEQLMSKQDLFLTKNAHEEEEQTKKKKALHLRRVFTQAIN